MSDLDDWYDYEEDYNEVFLELDPRTNLIQCSSGVLRSLFPLLSSIVVFAFIQKVILSFESYLNRKTMDFLVGSLGITFLFYKNVNITSIFVSIAYFLFGFGFLRIFRTYRYLGPVFIILSLIGTILCQSILDQALFLSFRGSWMIMTMKLVSLSFDIHEKDFEDVGFFETFGYVFNPATYFFGLFTSYKRYKEVKGFSSLQEDLNSVFLSFAYFVISCFSVFYGDCLLETIPVKIQFLQEFKDAQGFRFGHYFVNYFLWSTALLGGFRGSDLKIVDALKIEIPRSMEEVVSCWNIPMHEFLHKYVYSKTKPMSQPIAVVLTFLTSALMHGLNFQISAVLISLGIFAYSESAFRSRLSKRLNLCVKSRSCKTCTHRTGITRFSTVTTYLINFIFVVVNVVLLVYLGMPFDNSETAPIGYSMDHTLRHWGRWNFGGHGAALNVSCKIPELDPFNPDIIKLTKKLEPLECYKNKDWVYVDEDFVLRWTEFARSSQDISSLTCSVAYIIRKDDHSNNKETVKNVKIGTYKVLDEFFQVYCSSSIFNSWRKNFMISMPKAKKSTVINRLNIIMLGTDSVSHMEFLRSLPRSYNYLTEVMKSITLNGYNIVGDGTPQAFLPILTGQTEVELPLTRKRYREANFVDIYPFIWNNFSEKGYVTGFGEDMPYIDMFSFRLKGFNEQPTDHYLRPLMLELFDEYGYDLDCNGETPTVEEWFKYIEGFLKNYKDQPVFGLFHHGLLTHEAERGQLLDEYLYDFLKRNYEKNLFKNTVVFTMADHGARFTQQRQTSQGQIEERMPFFSVYLPPKLRSHPAFGNLKTNADRLTTPFDIYSTFLDLLSFDDIPETEFTTVPTRPLERSLSLFRPIPSDRTCKEANIEPHWCTCVAWRPIMGDGILRSVGEELVLETIKVFNEFLKEEQELCAELRLSKIDKMEKLAPDEKVLSYNGVKDKDGFEPNFEKSKILRDFVTYKLSFWTEPGSAHYEITVMFNEESRELKIDGQAISHVNKYGNLPHCVIDRNYFLGSFCVCKDMMNNLKSK